MSVKNYQKCIPVQAIQFEGTEYAHVQEIIGFVGMPIMIEYSNTGVRLRVIRSTFDVIVANVGDYIVKSVDGILSKISETEFNAEYKEVTA